MLDKDKSLLSDASAIKEGVTILGAEGKMTDNGAVEHELTADSPTYTIPEGYHNGNGTVSAQFSGGGKTDTVVIDKNTPNPLIIDTGIKDLQMFNIMVDKAGTSGVNTFSSATYYASNPGYYTAAYRYSSSNSNGNTYAINGTQQANFFVVNSVVDGVVSLKPPSGSSWYGTATWVAM